MSIGESHAVNLENCQKNILTTFPPNERAQTGWSATRIIWLNEETLLRSASTENPPLYLLMVQNRHHHHYMQKTTYSRHGVNGKKNCWLDVKQQLILLKLIDA